VITILFFAHLQEQVGKDKIEVEAGAITVAELKLKLMNDFNFSSLDQVMFAINEEYAENDDLIKQGDTVALIPPVSGG
jgi:sulfur-carrier protein